MATVKGAATTPNTSKAIGVAVAVLVAVVVAAIIGAMVLGGGDDTSAESTAAQSALIPTDGTLRQVSFAEAAGQALPKYDSSSPVDAALGMSAPTITASHFDNSEVTIDFADGQPRAVLFMAHWCPHCQAEVQSLVAKFETEGVRQDVELVAISTSVDAGAPNHPPSAWLIREGWPVPVLRDSQSSDLATGFGLSGYPFLVLVNGSGEIVSRSSGAVPTAQWNSTLDIALVG